MTFEKAPLPGHLKEVSHLGEEISITGKWIPVKKGGVFRKSAESKEMRKEWEDIHTEARNHPGMLATEINHAIGQDAVLVHHVFENEASLGAYFGSTASQHAQALMTVARPDIHLVRGTAISNPIKEAIKAKVAQTGFGEFLFGYVKHANRRPDPKNAIQVTAKWTCNEEGTLEELTHWWQQVGTDAFEMEKGLVRFETYRVPVEKALILHETFDSTDELMFHLTKGTAHKYKKNLDRIAAPENYFFRGPVSWMIRTYSKFMHLPATYSQLGSHYVTQGGSKSDGLIK